MLHLLLTERDEALTPETGLMLESLESNWKQLMKNTTTSSTQKVSYTPFCVIRVIFKDTLGSISTHLYRDGSALGQGVIAPKSQLCPNVK